MHKPVPITSAVTPLRLIFWGSLLCVFDFSFSQTTAINGEVTSGFRFDVLNDFVGMVLVTIGVSRLAGFAIDGAFVSAMRFVVACSVLNCIEPFFGHFVFRPPPVFGLLANLLGLATLLAIFLFCTCMLRLAIAYGLPHSTVSWFRTRWLVIALWVIPLGLIHLLGLWAFLTGQSFHWNLGLLIIPLLVVFLIPLIHLFISTSRMRQEANGCSH